VDGESIRIFFDNATVRYGAIVEVILYVTH